MSNKQTTALSQLKKHLQKDVKLKFILQKDVDRINWYIDTYFVAIERKQIEDAYKQGLENGYHFDGSRSDYEAEGTDKHLTEQYFTSTFIEE